MTPQSTSHMRLYSSAGHRLYLNGTERDAFRRAALRQPLAERVFCLLLLETGCRLLEARYLRFRDVQPSEGKVAFRTLKQRKPKDPREVPIPPYLVEGLLDLFGDGQQPDRRLWPASRTTAWRWVKAVMIDAKIAGRQASPKGLRHGYGIAWIMAGLPVFTLSKFIGHARLETTMIYAMVSGPEERRLAERLWV